MNEEYKRGYSKGYNARSERWPEHRPPVPPHKYVRRLLEAALKLRDAADNICATLDPDDDFVKELGPGIDAVDAANIEITRWLRSMTDAARGAPRGNSAE